MKTEAYMNYEEHIKNVADLIGSADHLPYEGIEYKKILGELNRTAHLGKALVKEVRDNYLTSDRTAFRKYTDLVLNTFTDHLNHTGDRLFATKYTGLVCTGLTPTDEHKLNDLINLLPELIDDEAELEAKDLSAIHYLHLQEDYDKFVDEHNFLLGSIVTQEQVNKPLPLKSIFKKEEYFNRVDTILTEYNASKLTERQGYILFAIIDSCKELSEKLLKENYSDKILLSTFVIHLGCWPFAQLKRTSPGFATIKREVKPMLQRL